MKIGDLVEHDGRRWSVLSYDQAVRVGTVVDAQGTRMELADDGGQVVATPSSWPTLAAPVRSRAGPFVKLVIPSLPGFPERVLEPWVDWIQSDPVRDGGSLFIHPDVRLLPGVVLIGTHRSGALVRIQVPRTYGTVAQKQAARVVAALPPEPVNRFNRILDDDD
jgi:hypothetical protein